MKTINILSLILISIIGIILCFVLVINIFGYRSNIANGITGIDIKKITLGMPLEQVISILGYPYEIKSLAGLHNFNCKNPKPKLEMNINENTAITHIIDSIYNDAYYCCTGNEEDILRGKRVTFTYTKSVSFSKYYPMLWVHLDSNYCVNSVYAKRYEWFDDICIYSLSHKLDEITLEEKPNEVDIFIDNELFNKCFK